MQSIALFVVMLVFHPLYAVQGLKVSERSPRWQRNNDNTAVHRRDSGRASSKNCNNALRRTMLDLRGGGWFLPAGCNPFGYKITPLGEEFLSYKGSLESDVGRFLASMKSKRKRRTAIKASWLEVVRASKQAFSIRIYKNIDGMIKFCLDAGFID
jgi:hypothetical protein